MADPKKVITFSRSSSGPPRLPKQRSRIGKMGYVGQVVEFDPAYPDIDLVPENEVEVVEEEPQEVAEKELKTPVRNKSRAKTKTKEASE